MNSTSTHFMSTRRIAMYEPINQMGMWEDNFKHSCTPNIPPASLVVEAQTNLDNQSEDTSHGTMATPIDRYDQEASTRSFNKTQRRLAQNREAARKSRLRKKAYVQQLEASRIKLMQLEQEFKRARQQGLYIGGVDPANLTFPAPVNSGIAVFEIEYGHWVDEQNRQICELRNALNAHLNEVELRVLVENGMKHYFELFQMKAVAAKADVSYIICGLWKTSSERFFLWIGGFRPSELLKLHPLADQQFFDACNLRQSCQQAEDALSQGMDKLQQTLAETVAFGQMSDRASVEKLEALISFVNQADHLRQETLLQMSRILTTQQAAQGLLALGEYFQRLRTLSSLWVAHRREPA
ncbi:transcription factor TGA4-like isoform X2 [Punica granatum]|uniref:Transcription factor TGA4-like isoform X2 n=1 Tax=Punica granatum TaxID=22663 RepID=A0A6P8CLW6_PUNGR|nr:transcription factor TGA4-like isoform X2 [Punica granatum]